MRGINHFQTYMPSDEFSPKNAAIEYVRQIKDVVGVSQDQLAQAYQKVNYLEPMERDVEYRLSEEKSFFDSTTTSFVQTYLNVPIWLAGI